MRIATLSLVGAACLAFSAMAASAAPSAPIPAHNSASNIVQTAGGCGWGFHPNRWHRCVPNRYGYYRARPYWRGYGYYPGGYGGYYAGYYPGGYRGYYGGGYYSWGGQDQNGISYRDHFSGGY